MKIKGIVFLFLFTLLVGCGGGGSSEIVSVTVGQPAVKKICTVGDSNDCRLTEVVSETQSGYEYLNLGVGGYTTAQMLQKLRSDTSVNGEFGSAWVWGGTNDLITGVSVDEIKKNLQDIYNILHYRGITVVALTVMPFGNWKGDPAFPLWGPWTPEKQVQLEELNHWIINEAQVDHVVNLSWVADPNNPFIINPRRDRGDGVHVTDETYRDVGTFVLNKMQNKPSPTLAMR
ncbi:MAG: GDSL-type esterase/lipase family protein [Candidatus Paceibacterota bacterium]|jgi:lysophospholipase L1-like esterase